MISLILLQVDPNNLLGSVNNLYSLIGLVVLSIVYIVAMVYNKKQDKKQTNEIIETFEEQNDNIIKKIEELRENKNILDEQSSMDILGDILNKSKFVIIYGIKKMLDTQQFEQKSMYIPKKSLILEKVKTLVDSEFKEGIITLSRIYNNNIKLSHYLSEIDTTDLVNEISHKIFSLTDGNSASENDVTIKENIYKNIVEYIESRFSDMIQSIELQLSK